MTTDITDELVTLRDWLRWAVSRFNAAELSYGHGTERALDEAAFLILHTLHLAPDDLETWLDARLTGPERAAVRDIVEARIQTRKPAPYLTGVAWIRGHRFFVDERTIVPRSLIGEMLVDEITGDDLPAFGIDPLAVGRVLDLCTGGGSLAILAALAYPAATVDAVDISAAALEVARRNVDAYGLGDRISIIEGDLFAPLRGRRYDLVLSNPPYVTDAAVAAFPPEHRAEPRLAHAGGTDGLDVVRRILAAAADHIEPEGTLVVEIGQEREVLAAAYPELAFHWLDTAETHAEVFALPASALSPSPARAKRRKSGPTDGA